MNLKEVHLLRLEQASVETSGPIVSLIRFLEIVTVIEQGRGA